LGCQQAASARRSGEGAQTTVQHRVLVYLLTFVMDVLWFRRINLDCAGQLHIMPGTAVN